MKELFSKWTGKVKEQENKALKEHGIWGTS